jgi:hypothetical protein
MNFSLTKDQFSNLIRVLSILQDECNDCDIRNGVVRQFNNAINSIFHIELSNFIQTSNIPMSLLKQKIEMFKNFSDEEEIKFNVSEEVEGGHFIIAGKHSSLRMDFPKLEYLDNKFMDEEDFARKIADLKEDNLILSSDINKGICNKIKGISKVFNSEAVKLVFNGKKAGLVSQSAGKDNFIKFITNLDISKDIPKSVGNLYIALFTIDHDDDISLSVHLLNDDLIVAKSSAKVGDIEVDVFARANLLRL